MTGNAATSVEQAAGGGGGILLDGGTATFGNTIIAGNTTAGSNPDVNVRAEIPLVATSRGYNLIGDGTGNSIFTAFGDQVGSAGSPLDALLVSLADNDGPMLTHALLEGSPAIDGGNNALASAAGIDFDPRGLDRFFNGTVDIGAFESKFAGVNPCHNDEEPPVITLIDSNSITVNCGGIFVDPGVTVFDNCDHDLTGSVTVGGDTVDLSTPGIYLILYTVTDSSGNSVEQGRAVMVADNCSGGNEGEGEGEGEGEPSQEIAQALLDDFSTGDGNSDGRLNFAEAQSVFADLTQAAFDLLDSSGDEVLSRTELELTGAMAYASGGGCFSGGKSLDALSDLKDFFGDLFLLGLLSIVLVAWRGIGLGRA